MTDIAYPIAKFIPRFHVTWILAVALLVIAFVAFLSWRSNLEPNRRRPSFRQEGAPLFVSVAAAIAAIVVLAIGLFPYDSDYWTYDRVDGVVRDVDSRIVTDSDGTEEKYLITYEDGDQVRCDDTKCAAVERGDRLVLECRLEWLYSGADGRVCNFIANLGKG